MANDATFHFAWVDPSATTFSAGTHAVEDEDVFSLEIAQTEGEFATAQITVQRPEDGLLNPTRKQYAWISVTNDATTTALFFGRVVGFPKDISSELVTLEFISQFPGWEASRDALFDTLKVLPFWDPAFIAKGDIENPDQALEARRALYHFDRLTGAVSLSDIITGTATDTVSDHLSESLSVDIIGNPARRVRVSMTVDWEQRILGETSTVNTKIKRAFGGTVNTFTGPAMQQTWPQAGDSIGDQSGYSVVKSEIRLINPLPSAMGAESTQFKTKISDAEQSYARALFNQTLTTRDAKLKRWWFSTILNVGYDFRQNRSETITATITNDVQALAFGSDGGEISIDLQSEDVVDLGLFYPRYSSYFHTARGKQSFHYGLALAQAALASSARAVEITFERPFFNALSTSCKNAITLTDPVLPGGTATGKIKSYRLSVDGDSGETSAEITLAVSVGNGDTYSSAGTTGEYCSTDYTGTTYQEVTGETADGDIPSIIYETYGNQQPTDPAIISHLANQNVVQSVTVTSTPTEQDALLQANQYPVLDDVSNIINSNPTEVALALRSLEPFDDLSHTITVTIAHPFAAPMGIDLSA